MIWIPMDSHGGLCPPSHGTACATKSSATPRGSWASENPMASKTNSMKLPVMGNDSSHLVASRSSKSARITMSIILPNVMTGTAKVNSGSKILGVLRFSAPSKAVVRQVKLSYSCGVKLHLTLFPYVCPQLAQPLGVQQWPAAIQPCDRHKHILP